MVRYETYEKKLIAEIGLPTSQLEEFVTEMKNHLDPKTLNDIISCGVDLDQIQVEQHHAFLQRKKKKTQQESGENLLGYSWTSVSQWKYKENERTVELYDKDGKVLDKIDLEQAIKSYVEILSGITETDALRMQEIIKNHEKEYHFLKLIYDEKVSIETAEKMLNISPDETNTIIKRLVQLEILKFASKDSIELTEAGKEFISQ